MIIPIIGIILNWKILGKGKWCILISLFTMLMTNLISLFYNSKFSNANTTPIFVIFINFFSFLLFYFYFLFFIKTKFLRWIQKIVIFLFILVFAIMALIDKEEFFMTFPIYFYFFEIVLLMVSISLFLYDTFNSDAILNIKNYFPFWVSLSLIVLFVGLLPVLLFVNSVETKVNRNVYMILVFFINLIGYGILSYGTFRSRNVLDN